VRRNPAESRGGQSIDDVREQRDPLAGGQAAAEAQKETAAMKSNLASYRGTG
jgi:hypothetical protein